MELIDLEILILATVVALIIVTPAYLYSEYILYKAKKNFEEEVK